MKFTQKEMSLFDLPEDYMLAHCISSDFGMGAGIVVMFNKLFNMKNVLINKYPRGQWNGIGYVIPEGKVYNLITKEMVYHKPTYQNLKESLECMREDMIIKGYKKLGIPFLGCGIDGLKWSGVYPILEDIFKNTDIEIQLCYLEADKELLNK